MLISESQRFILAWLSNFSGAFEKGAVSPS
jgi:hypothetical protein